MGHEKPEGNKVTTTTLKKKEREGFKQNLT